jgi:hypothetical protein
LAAARAHLDLCCNTMRTPALVVVLVLALCSSSLAARPAQAGQPGQYGGLTFSSAGHYGGPVEPCYSPTKFWPIQECSAEADATRCNDGAHFATKEECCERAFWNHKCGPAPGAQVTGDKPCWVPATYWPRRTCSVNTNYDTCNSGVRVWLTEEECCAAGAAFGEGCGPKNPTVPCYVPTSWWNPRACSQIDSEDVCIRGWSVYDTMTACCAPGAAFTEGCGMPKPQPQTGDSGSGGYGDSGAGGYGSSGSGGYGYSGAGGYGNSGSGGYGDSASGGYGYGSPHASSGSNGGSYGQPPAHKHPGPMGTVSGIKLRGGKGEAGTMSGKYHPRP